MSAQSARRLPDARRWVTVALMLVGVSALLAVACAPTVGSVTGRAFALPPVLLGPVSPVAARDVILATTTSTMDSGLLEVLIPTFERETGYRVKPVSVGTGAALALAARGEADVVLTHAPSAEREWMAQGYGASRQLVMHNDFVILGPPADPAGVRGMSSAHDALRKVAGRGAMWISRDDNSGTHQLEQRLWHETGIGPGEDAWYITSGAAMGATLTLADHRRAYTLADRATYLARRRSLDLEVLVEGDALLLNPYHVMPVDAVQFPGARMNAAGGAAFADFLLDAQAQRLIGDFGRDRYGAALFMPDAGRTEEALGR